MSQLTDIDGAIRPQGSHVVLSAAVFQNDALSALLNQFFSDSGGTITIVDATEYHCDPTAQTIQFKGTGKGGPFDTMAVGKVLITIVAGVPRLEIEAARADGWTLALGFPALKAPVLTLLPFSNAALSWASYQKDGSGIGFQFQGVLDFDAAPLNLLKFLFQGQQAPTVSGSIDMVGTAANKVVQFVPDMMFTVDATDDEVKLGPLTIDGPQLDIRSDAYFNTFDNNWATRSYVRLSSLIRLTTAGDEHVVLITADIGDTNSLLAFEADMDEPIGAALTELASFVGSELKVPSFKLNSPGDLSLKKIRLLIDPNGTNKLQSILFDVGMSPGEKWQLWSDKVFLENIEVTFDVSPSDGQVDGTIRGNVDGWLDLRAEFSNKGQYKFFGSLAQSTSIAQIYRFFAGTDLTDLPNLNVEALEFELDIDTQQKSGAGFVSDLELDGAWQIVPAPLISLEGVRFNVSHGPATGTDVEARAVLSLADYSLGISGVYSSDKGWNLNGDLTMSTPGQSLESIIAKIDQELKIATPKVASIPHFLVAWVVDSLHVDFFTGNRQFDFDILIGNADLPGFQMGFGIHLTHGGTDYTRTLDATAHYAAPRVDVDFTFDFAEQTDSSKSPPSKTITATGSYSAKIKPKLSDLLLAVAKDLKLQEGLPAELNLDAEPDGFAIKVEQVDKNPPLIEAAGAFSVQIEGSNLDVYLAYTNRTAFDAGYQQPAMVDGKRAFVAGVSLGGLFDLSRMPVLGKIPGVDRLRIDKLGFYYTNATLQAGQQLFFEVPQTDGPTKLAADRTASVLARSGFNLVAVFGSQSDGGGGVSPVGSMPAKVMTGPPPAGAPPAFASQAAQPDSPVKWLDVNKTFGPVDLKKVGLNYSSGEATIGFSAGLSLGGFTLQLEALTVTFPMPLPGMKAGGVVAFDLLGLSFDVNRGALSMGGAFLKVPENGFDSYYGEILVHAANFGLKALGGYTPAHDGEPASLFLYAKLDVPLGGPPFLFVTGLAAGFGINRGLILPTIETLPGYLLLPSKAPPQAGSAGDTLKNVLKALSCICPDRPGEYWVAAGVQFTSFEMIDAFALVTVSFGVDLQIALLGTSAMTFPKGDPAPVAYAEIDIVASFTPSTGLFSIFGVVSPASFVYGGFCHLYGGFAFDIWFSGEHRGDFVVSLGGYHPAFNKPAHYPAVPRLGMSFALGQLQVNGQAYFALTPGMMMAGLTVSAVWNTDSIKAWLNFDVDFLIAWAPFHYEANAFINIGCSVDTGLTTINAHLGANLIVWGPAFGGRVHVDLDVVAFTIEFGAAATLPLPVGWSGFKNQFLPKETAKPQAVRRAAAVPRPNSNAIKVSVAAGLLGSEVGGFDWIIDPDSFAIVTSSVVPANNAAWQIDAKNDYAIPTARASYNSTPSSAAPYLDLPSSITPYSANEVWNPTLHVRPMKRENVKSYHRMQLWKLDESTKTVSSYVTRVSLQPELTASNCGLWGPSSGTLNGPALLPATLAGFRIKPYPQEPVYLSSVRLEDLLFEAGYVSGFSETAVTDRRYTVSSAVGNAGALSVHVSGDRDTDLVETGYVLGALIDPWITAQRASLVGELSARGITDCKPDAIDLEVLATQAALQDWPQIAILGGDRAVQPQRGA
jgi:hypothetical protein